MATNVRRVRTMFALALGVVVFGAVTAPAVGAATPSYEFAARDSGALPGRVFSAAAGAADGESVVLYGGERPGDATDKMFGDTWVYRPTTGWVAQCGSTVAGATGACGPGTRSAGAMASGPTGLVLFGGAENGLDGGGGSGPASDTWVWNNGGWTQVCATGACGPSGRMFPAMGGNGEQVVLFGGLTGSGVADDTWVFDGTTWTQRCGTGQPLACGPAGLAAAAIGWDGTQFVMFGGAPMGSSDLADPIDDTWVFDGTTWTQRCGTSMATPCGPQARALASIAFQRQPDPALQGAVLGGGGSLFTGGAQRLDRDVWFWRADAWTQLATPWPDASVAFTDGDPPPEGSGPLLGLVTAQPSECQVLFLGQDPTYNPDFDVAPQTFSGGWDLTGTVQAPGCTAQPAETPGGTPIEEPSAVPVASPTDVAASGSGSGSGSMARTGQGSDRLAAIGFLAVVIGLGASWGARPRREPAEAHRPS